MQYVGKVEFCRGACTCLGVDEHGDGDVTDQKPQGHSVKSADKARVGA